MRKHFLILMLLTLLPFTAWAVDYSTWTVTLSESSSTYDGTAKTAPTVQLTKTGETAVTITNGSDGWTLTWSSADWTNAGPKTLTVTNSGTHTAPTANTATYTINPFNITGATVTLTSASAVYSAADVDFPTLASVTKGASTFTTNVTITGWKIKDGAAVTKYRNAGVYECTVQANGSNLVGTTTGTFTVNKAPVTVTANSFTGAKAITFGDAAPEAQYSVTYGGVLAGDKTDDVINPGVITGTVTYNTKFGDVAYVAGDEVKGKAQNYAIIPTITGLTSANYDVLAATVTNGTLTVNKKDIKDLTIQDIDAITYAANDNTKPAAAAIKLMFGTKEVAASNYSVKYYNESDWTGTDWGTATGSTTGYRNVGRYYVELTATGANYKGTNKQLWQISRAPLLIKTKGVGTEAANKKPYDGVLYTANNTTPLASSSDLIEQQGWLAGESTGFDYTNSNLQITLEPVDGGSADGDAGKYLMVVNVKSGTSKATVYPNYNVTFQDKGYYVIEKKPLTFAVTNQYISYSDENPFAADVTDAKAYTTVTPATPFAGMVGGTFSIKTYPTLNACPEATGTGDYDLTLKEGTAVIEQNLGGTPAVKKDKTSNFDITLTAGKLTIEGGVFAIIPDNVTDWTYGQTAPDITYEISDIRDEDDTPALRALIKANIKYDGDFNAGPHNAKIIVDKAAILASDYYKNNLKNKYSNINVFTANYTIAKRKLTKIEVKNQSLNSGVDKITDLVKSENTVVFTAAKLESEEEAYQLTPDDYALLQSEYKFVLNGVTFATASDSTTVINAATTNAKIGIYYVNSINKFKNFEVPASIGLGTTATANYTVGKLTLSAAVASVQLARAAITSAADVTAQMAAATTTSAYNVIKANAGHKVSKVTFTLPGHTMKAETWYSWVLPFATTVKDISNAFGYAVVDILDEGGLAGKADDVKFKLHMGDIEANQPFILKVYKDIKPEEFTATSPATTINFTNVTIINANAEVTDANGNKFIGTYSGKYGLESNEYLFRLGVNDYSKGGDKSSIRPLGAYIQFATPSNAHTIYIEEPDGSTTAISSIAADGEMIPAEGWYTLNGVKLQGAPTEKGVYINNGKKVVVK